MGRLGGAIWAAWARQSGVTAAKERRRASVDLRMGTPDRAGKRSNSREGKVYTDRIPMNGRRRYGSREQAAHPRRKKSPRGHALPGPEGSPAPRWGANVHCRCVWATQNAGCKLVTAHNGATAGGV